jgi:hypothetical protein
MACGRIAALIAIGLTTLPPSAVLQAQQPRRTAQAANPTQARLNRAADALLALKSTRFALKREGAPAVLDAASGLTFTNTDCAYAAPDRVSCDIKVALKNGTVLQLTRVWVPEGLFQSNPLTRQFVKVPADTNFNGAVLFSAAGIPELLRSGVQNPQPAGTETIRNQPALHIKGAIKGERLNRVIGSALNAESNYAVDLWIEDRSSLPSQIHLADAPGSGWLIELTGVNEPITIPTPQVPASTSRPPA